MAKIRHKMKHLDPMQERVDELLNKDHEEMIKESTKPNQKKYKKKNEEPEFIAKSFYQDEEYIYEQIYNDTARYARYNKQTEQIDYVDYIEKHEENQIIMPIENEAIQKKVIILPEKAEEYGSIEDLDTEILGHINKWLDIDPTYARFATWNIRFSWLYDRFNTLNYTRALGDTGTGKSRFLNVIGNISYKPMRVAGALTPATIFRIIDKWKGTLIIDEADQKDSDEANAFIKILNCGYEQGMAVCRVDKEDLNKLLFYDVFCPKVISTRRRFDDKATEARCMTKIMTQTMRNDIPDILTKEYFYEATQIRNRLLTYRLRNYEKIDPEAGLKVDLTGYEPRLRQVNRGFIGLFSHDKEEIAKFKEYLAKYQKQIVQERSESFDGGIVMSIADLIIMGHENITCNMIAEHINREYATKYEATHRSVGKHVRSIGLELRSKKIEGRTMRVINDPNNVMSVLFFRYIFDEDVLEKLRLRGYLVTEVTDVTEEGASITFSPFLHDSCLVSSVTSVTGNLLGVNKKTLKELFSKHKELTEQELINKGYSEAQLRKYATEGLIFSPRAGVWALLT